MGSPPDAPPARTGIRVGAVGLAVVLALGVAVGWPRLPASLAEDAPPERFSGDRAWALVARVAREPRPTGSAAQQRVLAVLATQLRSLGFEVVRDVAQGLQNLVARAPGAGEDGVWLVAHSDSVAAGPGAADDGFGLGVLVEAARVLALEAPPAGLHLLITDGEEAGLLGAAAFVRAAPPARRVVINVEARGTEGPVYMFQTAGPTGAMLAAWQRSGCDAQATSLARAVYGVLPNDTDFTRFRAAGWWGYDFAIVHGAWRYHTPEDTPEHLDRRSLQQAGECVVGLTRAWLEGPPAGDSDDITLAYAQVAGVTRTVPGPAVRAVGAALLGAGVYFGRRAAWGVAAWAVALGFTLGAGFPLLAVWSRVRPDFWDRPAEMTEPGLAWGSGIVLGVAVPGLVWRLARRAPRRGWHAAGMLLAGGVALVVPEVGYLLVPGALVSWSRCGGRPLLGVLPALLAGALLGPFGHAIFPALTSRALQVLALVPLLTLGWLLPTSDSDGPGRRA